MCVSSIEEFRAAVENVLGKPNSEFAEFNLKTLKQCNLCGSQFKWKAPTCLQQMLGVY